ncbi:MAG: N-acetylneuraminate synthase [Clostridia bacterium BRH_c25]|nr:MAG: N-acetylneuraminate synthase [Clostridia bacterium BRH_c25]
MHTFVIAEVGVNHNGSIETAKKLVDIALKAGCDAIKFQTFKAEKIVTRQAKKAEYQIRNTSDLESQYEMLKVLELSQECHLELIKYCKCNEITFLSTPFDEESSDFLESIGLKMFKIPSGEITNKPLIQHIAKKQKPIILSTGMSTLGEVEEALEWIYEEGNTQITLLHCTSNYPTIPEDVNLRAMITLKQAFNIKVGYSDHTLGIEIPLAAVALGATIIEKHITLSKEMEGPDHKASLEPYELIEMVSKIRNLEKALGDGLKRPTIKEYETRTLARKSIVAVRDISTSEVINIDMLTCKRPGSGLAPKYIDMIVGKIAKRSISADEQIDLTDVY